TFKLDLPKEMLSRGLTNAFHASLLRLHHANDDRLFPGRQMHQLPSFNEDGAEWAIDRILSHSGQGTDSMFEVQWTTGDVTWATYHEMKGLNCLDEYFEAMGITGVRNL
ncbi:hypothetical protein PENSPDRAFT_555063, partial [Peniophora sp. CONT]